MNMTSFLPHQDQVLTDLFSKGVTSLDEAYQSTFIDWKLKHPEPLSIQEQALSFEQYLHEQVQLRTQELIKTQIPGVAAQEAMMKQARRGKILLASKDGGRTFDQLLSPEQAETVNPLDYELLTPTFRSASNDLQEVFKENMAVNHIHQLKAEHFQINGIHFEGEKLIVDCLNKEAYTVEVDLNPQQTQPTLYTFTKQGEKGPKKVFRVSEDQLATSFGNLEVLPESELEQKRRKPVDTSQLAGLLPLMNLNAMAQAQAVKAWDMFSKTNSQQNEESEAQEQMFVRMKESMPKHSLSNVQASKKARTESGSLPSQQEQPAAQAQQEQAVPQPRKTQSETPNPAPQKSTSGFKKALMGGMGIGILGGASVAAGTGLVLQVVNTIHH